VPPSEASTLVDDRAAAVMTALAAVVDPELDQSVVDLGFIAEVAVDDDRVTVSFRLPTFWCSASFAWIMAEDMRTALSRLGWVRDADIRLVDHFAAEKINTGIAGGDSFREAFGDEAAGDLAALRENFRKKAFLGRMAAMIEALRADGHSDEAICALTVSNVATLPGTAREIGAEPAGEPPHDIASLAACYLELREIFGGPAEPEAPAFVSVDGAPVTAAGFAAFLRDIRMTRRSVEANGEMCRILLAARNKDPVGETA
jgi:metal-sulfur cluster biosynthetic enzyme